jgi:DNA replication and repair protein RecF
VGLAELRLADLRCLPAAELALHPRFNLITGANGEGKTSLLEAAYLLGRGRSFRTRHTEQLIRAGAPRLWVAGRTFSERRVDLQCGRGQDRGVEARIDGRTVNSLVELSEVFPVQVLDPGIHRLIEEGPLRRRQWLDWAMFHVEPAFLPSWQGYTRALRQRSAALQAGADPAPWEAELARLGEMLSAARARLVDGLQPCWRATLEALEAVPAALSFYPGWPRQHALAQLWVQQRAGDRELGRARLGPHRFDIVLKVEGRPARDAISRGQQKVLGAAMALSMARYLAQVTERTPTLLLDDPAAELDERHAARLLASVADLGGQHLVTAMRPDTFRLPADRVFHVEQGGVKTL